MVKTQYLIKKNVFKMIFRALWWALKEEACSTLGEIRYNNCTIINDFRSLGFLQS